MNELDHASTGERERGELLRLEQLARELRRGRPVSPETQRHNDRLADGLRAAGDVIRWLSTGEQPGEGAPITQRAKVARIVEDLGLVRPNHSCADRKPSVD